MSDKSSLIFLKVKTPFLSVVVPIVEFFQYTFALKIGIVSPLLENSKTLPTILD